MGIVTLVILSCPTLATADPGPADPRVELAALRADLEVMREEAGEKIERYVEESERLEELAESRATAEERAEEALEHGESSRSAVARQAAAVYKGADLSPVRALFGVDGPAGMLDLAADLTLLGDHRATELARAEAAGVAAGTLSETARAAERDQERALERAETAREEAEAAILAQEEALRDLLAEQTRLEARPSGNAGSGEAGSPRRNRTTPWTPGTEAGAHTGAGTGDRAVCPGGDVGAHENGRIPESLLCPLPQPGERLRADAAAAFVELDAAYRERFGRAMCVADSYRPYHEQVALFQQMSPGMAARPGTSTHGKGLAVDLCGGVNVLGGAEHEWMLAHAPAHGWDNPPWARGGFEPWHWEFTP
ncbi:M15 family metallopeptidase [Nocardiopsis sp. N85]|uniref:M15 family metallopeptidase n=1 Tax=Nocardiopsis sp. N85 TaxID=3029400 RepID=UPI00237F373A|nr:M15 family metallopeptidase [Nocardiopsis sp. N85]MDE3720184.1 M15 family metallopeptidase [Nocardiopsis sp. N85]